MLRLHALTPAPAVSILAASLAPLSALGAATAREIARVEGADMEIALDDCCCAQAALAANALAEQDAEYGASVIPFIPSRKREPT